MCQAGAVPVGANRRGNPHIAVLRDARSLRAPRFSSARLNEFRDLIGTPGRDARAELHMPRKAPIAFALVDGGPRKSRTSGNLRKTEEGNLRGHTCVLVRP